MEKVGFGGGCHWCTEGVFQTLRGVVHVDQGFIQSDKPWDAWAEAVIVGFDPSIISLRTLTEVHLRTHSAQQSYSPGGKYRSAIYTFSPGQCQEAAQTIADFAYQAGAAARTIVLPFVGFRPSDDRYQNYYRTDPRRPFCRRYIDPKLNFVRQHFAAHALPEIAARKG